MSPAAGTAAAHALGLHLETNPDGTWRGLRHGDLAIGLFVGNALESGPANLVLRRLGDDTVDATRLLGPRSPTRWHADAGDGRLEGAGTWQGLHYRIALHLAADTPAWFWHLRIENTGDAPVRIDLLLLQDLALAPYAAVRMNEYYVSQYVGHTPLAHPEHGIVLASRQNQAVGTRHPWCAIGSLHRTVAYATDALQVHGLASRAGAPEPALRLGLPNTRLQHEHSMAALQEAACTLAPGESVDRGWFGCLQPDHPAATSPADLGVVAATLALAEATPPAWRTDAPAVPPAANLFSTAPLLAAHDLDAPELDAIFGTARRHLERSVDGRLLGFFHGDDAHVALRAKELAVLRPHGQVLRTGLHAVPDESALTSTVWMGGVFHSMLTQGHVSINRCLSVSRSYLGLFRAQGLRVFVEIDGTWQLLDQPSAFEATPAACRWIYRHAAGRIDVTSRAESEPHAVALEVSVVEGPALRCLVSLHVAFDGDDGALPGGVPHRRDGAAVVFSPAPASELGRRFAGGHWRLEPLAGTALEQVGGDGLLFLDGASREAPYLVVITASAGATRFRLTGHWIVEGADVPAADAPRIDAGRIGSRIEWLGVADGERAPADVASPDRAPADRAPTDRPLDAELLRLVDLLPWLRQNALVHYLAPRGLEQFSGGGWGTRDVCQGPLELLLAQGHDAPLRDLLLRVMKAQRADGDWPQWFMFFERDASIRAGDSHGDIVFWPVLALAQYLLSSGDASILDERVPFVGGRVARRGGAGGLGAGSSVWRHALRALGLIRRRVIAGTALAAYGHGDWNDALQPADPAMREHMCSAWTVTLHHQTLTTLARALRRIGRARPAAGLEREAAAVRRDFGRLLLVDGVLAGYAHFEPATASADRGAAAAHGEGVIAALASIEPTRPADATARIRYLLHPRDTTTGVRYSLLAMIHAILEGLFDAAQMRHHLQLIETHLTGPDGARLFDRPLAYHGGLQRQFQRAESASYFGREIGLMYMHAHLRYAQALAHAGEADGFFRALCQANPIGLRERVPASTLRQSNCYYSSSDARFADRYEAASDYARIASGDIALEGGWRVYSSGAGILYGLVVRQLFGLRLEADALLLDPVLPAALDGLRLRVTLLGAALQIDYRVRGSGAGVEALRLDGRPLAFRVDANPYRRGAARVDLALLAAALAKSGEHRLVVAVGEGADAAA